MTLRLLLASSLVVVSSTVLLAEAGRKTFTATINEEGVQEVALVGGSYFFDPSHIVVKVNVPIELRVRKESGVAPHNFVIDAPDAGVRVDEEVEDEPQTIHMTFTRVGDYDFDCTKKLPFLPSHRDKGMAGQIQVTD
jgi:plastocyanin